MKCEESKQLIPGYLDAELSEEQSAPLRQHLLECVTCRTVMQSDKALQGWFVQPAAVAIPAGFAARVARRAMAGDKGERFGPLPSAGPALITTDNDRRTYSFVLHATAIAATLLVALSIGIVSLRLPDSADLQADDGSLLISLDALDTLNALEQAADEAEEPKDAK